MTRVMTGLTVAFSIAFALAVQAQDSKVTTKTEVKSDSAKPVTYTGCVHTGTETRSYVLDKVVPVSNTTTVQGTSGTTTTTTISYVLVPGEKVEFEQLVGHKVEVTGMLMTGDTKTQTRTTIEREDAPDSQIKEKSKTDMPQFRVTSVKNLAESCS